ncbi:MAG: phosphoribosylformylglycinamidine synthase, partial [Lawsonibacter sp.]|nr:phosphoribosylformylglycinamidine synthase [Lawsonibacter sp.]
MSVYRCYSAKKPQYDVESTALLDQLRGQLGIQNLEDLSILHRYDVEDVSQEVFQRAKGIVFSEPQVDNVFDEDYAPVRTPEYTLAVEALPGQFDQRADSAAQCIQLMAGVDRPLVASATVYLFYTIEGSLSQEDREKIKKYLINPVESREASMDKPETLAREHAIPDHVDTVAGFTAMDEPALSALLDKLGLAMDIDDLKFLQAYFRDEEKRDPTITEVRVVDTYWSDHCRHTTFSTHLDEIQIDDPDVKAAYERYLAARVEVYGEEKAAARPQTLMDIATIGTKVLKKRGLLPELDESEEINACSIHVPAEVDGKIQDWLLMFKNETHNHPTEIEPFGGAATCIGGAIRDPLSGRSYVYAAMRVTGAADPLKPVEQTIQGKLPQRKLVTTAAAGYSSYGNQIGLATGQVDELYHPGYAAKRMEIGAVIAAAPAENVRRERPAPGDVVILLGGRTGRDGCGGATGSSKSHTVQSLESCGAEVQKGNAPEERKLQRLFRNPEAARLIKRCNDFGAGGVSVAVGELADGLAIDLDQVPKKYDGLDGTELAISESQERMAVVVAPEDVKRFCALADKENLEVSQIAVVTAEPRLVMRWNGKTIVDVSRAFLDTNGAEKHITVRPAAPKPWQKAVPADFKAGYTALAADLNVCSKRGLSERFDATIGAGTVLMPFGGAHQHTPIQAMVHTVSVEQKHTDTCSLMAWGYNPYIAENSPYHSAFLAVVESVSKLVATGAKYEDVYLTFQEYFEKPGQDAQSWGKPLSALLGAFMAQKQLRAAAIGGKDSMSGTFEQLTVPPTLVSFAVATEKAAHIVSNEFKAPGHKVVLLQPEYDAEGLPVVESLKALFDEVHTLTSTGKALAAYTPAYGGVAEAVMKMSFGNLLGFRFADVPLETLFAYRYGAFVLELADGVAPMGTVIGETTAARAFTYGGETIDLMELLSVYENKLEPVYPCNIPMERETIPAYTYTADTWPAPAVKSAKPRAVIPVFPGNNCEYDTAKALRDAGADPEIIVIRNLTAAAITESVDYFAKAIQNAQIVFIPGGFSGGDEPDGS